MIDSAPWTDDADKMRVIAESDDDHPVLMVNLNKYKGDAGFPNGKLYSQYMNALAELRRELGAKLEFQYTVQGQPVGYQNIDEIIGIWYPSHKAFLSIKEQKSSARNFELRGLRGLCIETAILHRVSTV